MLKYQKQNIYLNRCLTVTLAREVMSILTIIAIIMLKKDSGDIVTFICCSVKVLILSANGYVLIERYENEYPRDESYQGVDFGNEDDSMIKKHVISRRVPNYSEINRSTRIITML